MEKLLKILGLFLIPAFVLTSCSSDPESTGEDAGELECECHEINEKMEDIEDDLEKLEWDKEDEREEYADLMNEQFELGVEYDDLQAEIAELTLARFDQQEKKKDKDKWHVDFMKAKVEYIDNNCDDHEDLESLKSGLKWMEEGLKNK